MAASAAAGTGRSAHCATLPAGASSLEVVIDPLDDRSRLEREWRALEGRARPNFFLSWHWIGTWLATIDTDVHVVRVRTAERLVGLALIVHATDARHGILRVPTLFLNQTGRSEQDVVTIEFNDVLAERDLETAVRRTVLQHLARRDAVGRARHDAVVWRGAVGALRDDLDALGLPWRYLKTTTSAFVDLAAIRASGTGYLGHLSANTRRQIRRARQLYERRGPLRFEIATSKAEALGFFREAGILHQRRWRSRGKPGAFAFPFYVGFHERLIAAGQPAGVVELVRISAGDQPIGYLYNFLYAGHVYYYFSGFRFEDDNRLKPGLVSHCLCIEHHLARGDATYDFMGGDERYKLNLGQPGPEIVEVIVERPRLLLRLEATMRRTKHRLQAQLKRHGHA
jgi:CelD/BcsL family acetyltransferase involved in cellulose biosynthesis